ncbi:MAG: 3'-5' exonuclease, partial [Oscillospiraceae bacterium]
ATNEHDEAYYVAQKIREFEESYNNTVILYRLNALSRVIENALLKAAIPYRVLGGLRFYDRKEIKDLTSYLKLIQNNNDNVALRRVINEPKRGIGVTTVEKVLDIATSKEVSMFEICKDANTYTEFSLATGKKLEGFAQMILRLKSELDEGLGLELFVKMVLSETTMEAALLAEKTIENETRLENLKEFITMVQEAVRENAEITLGELLENISLVADIDNYDEAQETVTLMTLHSAKGLEFPNVFLVGMEESVFPSARSFGNDEEIEEERRLCYVGITRAKSRLFISRAQTRTLFGATKFNAESRFISEIPKELIDRIAIKKK